MLQSNIETHVKDNEPAETKVRNIAKELISALKQNKNSDPYIENMDTNDATQSSQPLFDDPSIAITTQMSHLSVTSKKRKHSGDSFVSRADYDDVVLEKKRLETLNHELVIKMSEKDTQAAHERAELREILHKVLGVVNNNSNQLDQLSQKVERISGGPEKEVQILENVMGASEKVSPTPPSTPMAKTTETPVPSYASVKEKPAAALNVAATPTTATKTINPPANQRKTTDTRKSPKCDPELILVSDSNGRYLNPKQLKPESEGIRKDRYTIDEAINNIPVLDSPEKVTDIVFQVGLNDSRRGASAEEIQNKMHKMQMQYNQKFPNARQHITALPPITGKSKEVNEKLQKLCSFTESNFISTKVFSDKASGKIRSGLTEGIHYTNWGVKILAKEMKKSLYSSANKQSKRLSDMRDMLASETNHEITPQPEPAPQTQSLSEPESLQKA